MPGWAFLLGIDFLETGCQAAEQGRAVAGVRVRHHLAQPRMRRRPHLSPGALRYDIVGQLSVREKTLRAPYRPEM